MSTPRTWPRLYQSDTRVAANIAICEACPEHGRRKRDNMPFCKLIVDDDGKPTECCSSVHEAVYRGNCKLKLLTRK